MATFLSLGACPLNAIGKHNHRKASKLALSRAERLEKHVSLSSEHSQASYSSMSSASR